MQYNQTFKILDNIRRKKTKHNLSKSIIVVLILFMAIQGGLFIVKPNQTVKAQSGTNLALGKAAYASSVQTVHVASRVTDGLTSTAWSSTFAEPAWIYIDLGSPQAIRQVILIWENAYGLEYRIEGSNDATTWSFLEQEFHGDGGTDYLSVDGTWRYIRMYGTQRGTGWGFSIWEFQIFDVAQPVPPTEPYVPSLPFKPVSQILFSDNFSSGNIAQWQIGRGTWQVTSGALTSSFPCSGGSPYMITAGDTTWTDYQLAIDIRRLAGYDPGGILIRNSESGYYRVDIMPSLPYGGAVRIVKSTTGANVQRSWPFNADTWYKIVIDVEGPTIDVYGVDTEQNATLMLSFTDTDAPFLTGNIGFLMTAGAVCPTQVAFDNIYVRQIEPSYLVSGVVKNPNGDPISKVQLSANGLDTSTITRLDGSYTLGRFVPDTYTITPVKSGYTFSPTSHAVNLPPDAINQDFTGQVITYSISGNVVDSNLNGLAGVTISDGAGHTATTDSSGNYVLNGLAAGTYTLTASQSGNTFSPASRPVPLPPSATNQDFTLPFLDLPLQYTKFSQAAQGSNRGGGPGYVNSWFDHTIPGYGNANGNLTTWQGSYTGGTYILKTNCDTKPGGLGISCYDEHDGIDFRHVSDTVLAAAPGTVESAGWGSFGQQVIIDHQNCFFTLYGHLKVISVGDNDPVTDRQQIGIMGNTGLSLGSGDGTHLHFGVYYDPDCDGDWTNRIPVDPYPWRGAGTDPWPDVPNSGLWKYEVSDPTKIDISGGSTTDPGDTYGASVPAGAVSDLLTFELLASPSVSAPSAQLRSTGYSFWLRILEWLGLSGSSPLNVLENDPSFNVPVTVTVNYDPFWMKHVDIEQLQIFQWNEAGQSWSPLTTTLDTVNNRASAQTSQPGYFDLQGPLICPADTLEPNDNYDGSNIVQTNGSFVSNLFDIAQDEDWFQFDALSGNSYTLKTLNLSSGVDTILEIYDTDGVTLLVSDDNSGGGKASSLTWQAPTSGTYFVRVRKAPGSLYGCNSSYAVSISIKVATPTFNDVPMAYWSWGYIERLYNAGITGGCSTNPLSYCPENSVTRAQMAVFLEKGVNFPSAFSPPNVAPTFTDTLGHWAEDWIEALRDDGITGGCGINLYCPEHPVTRAQMAVFLLKSKYGSSYTPPAVGTGTGFTDVPANHWAAPWIKQLAAEGITGGCGSGIYCPESPVTRAQMAVFLVKTFNLP